MREPRGPGWVVGATLLSYPLWWALGIGYVIWPLLALPMLFALLLKRDVRVPTGFGLWLLFLGWMTVSALELDKALRFALFGWRATVYLAGTIFFLYVFNAPRRALSDRTLAYILGGLWVILILGGMLGVVFPSASFTTPFERVLPSSFLQDPTAKAFVHIGFADKKFRGLGAVVGRPKTFFGYTNQWGSCVGVLAPFVFAALAAVRRRRTRRLIIAAIVLSVIPIVVSLNRGLWIALIIAFIYGAIRLAARNNLRAVGIGLVLATVTAAIIAITPLGSLLQQRLNEKVNSNQTRAALAQEAFSGIRQSPLLGYGSPRPSAAVGAYTNAHTGTQGQFFLVLFSHGIPGLVLYILFFGSAFIHSFRWRGSPLLLAAHLAILISLIEMWFYDFMPTTFIVIMVAAAVAYRTADEPPEKAPTSDPRGLPVLETTSPPVPVGPRA